jgi:hypothetical protein
VEPAKFPVVKNAHIVPRTYLRGFADDRGQIAIHVGREVDSHLMNIKKAGTRGKFYARDRPDGTEIHDIEWSLSQVEARAGPVLRQAGEGWPLGVEDKGALATLFALQILRGPRWMDWHKEFTEDYMVGQRDTGEHEDELIALEEHLLSKTETFAKMLDLGKKITPLLASMKWTLLEFKGAWLATSDHPVVLWPLGVRARQPQVTPHGVGLFEALEYRVPISAESAILMTWADGPDTRALAPKDAAASMNAFTVAEAAPQWFHLPGPSPPIASGSLTPLSPRFLAGYGHEVAASSPRRARVQQIVQPLIGKNTLRDETTEIVYIPAEPQESSS